MSKMLKSSGAMALATLASRVLGMVREILYAQFMGNGAVASAFMFAFQIPNLFRRLLGEGALTAAFIPLFKQKEAQAGSAEMWRAANAVICGLTVSASALTLGVMAAITGVLHWSLLSPETRLMLQLLRLMFPYMLLVCLAAVLIGMANARGHFFVPALGAVMLNVVMIGSVKLLAPRLGATLEEQIFGLAIGVLAAGLVQALFQWPSLKQEGYRFEWVSPWQDPTVREVVRKMLPGSIGVAAFQINIVLTQGFSYWFDDTIISTFNYAVRLMELPQGMFGISLATYLLPTLSGLAAEKKFPEFRHTLGQGLSYLAFANLMATAVAVGLATPIVRLLFEHGKFGPEATERVALALMCLAPGLLLFSMNNILARAFYALSDVKTPMKISIFCLGINLVFGLSFLLGLRQSKIGGEAGLGVANTLSACCNTALLCYALRKKLSRLELGALRHTLAILIPNALLGGVVAFGSSLAWEHHYGHKTLLLKVGAVFVPGALAVLVYWAVALGTKIPAATEMVQMVTSRLKR